MQTPLPQTATASPNAFTYLRGVLYLLPFPRMLRWSLCNSQGGEVTLKRSWTFRAPTCKSRGAERASCWRKAVPADVLGERIRSSGNSCRISLEHEGGFQLIWKSGSWHIPLCRSRAVWISCVHRWCSGCWSRSCAQSQNGYSLPHMPNPYPLSSQASSHPLSSILN